MTYFLFLALAGFHYHDNVTEILGALTQLESVPVEIDFSFKSGFST